MIEKGHFLNSIDQIAVENVENFVEGLDRFANYVLFGFFEIMNS